MSSNTPRLIFTNEVLRRIDPRRPNSAPLLVRWAQPHGDHGEAARRQLEFVASLTPPECRDSLLRPIVAIDAPDQQVRDAMGALLLAATLKSTGWQIEYEPQVGGQTPDLRIERNGATYIVESRRVTGALAPGPRDVAYARLQDALIGEPQTDTPIMITSAYVNGTASLLGFVDQLRAILATRKRGRHQIAYTGVDVTFEVRGPLGFETDVIMGGLTRIAFGSDSPAIQAALNEKLKRYKFPIIVALDLVDVSDGFRAARDALLGTVVFSVQVNDRSPDGVRSAPSIDRLMDGIVVGRRHEARRARDRLVGVLPFEWGFSIDRLFRLHAQLLANPASMENPQFSEFAPIPRLVVTRDDPEQRSMQYLIGPNSMVSDSPQPPSWSFTPPQT